VIAIDEVQYLSAEELGALITAVHRTTQLQLPLVLVGAGLPQVPALAGNAKSYAERLFTFPEIGALAPAEARQAVVNPAEAAGIGDTAFTVPLFDEFLKRAIPFELRENKPVRKRR
jgi:hypothetical protein